MKKISFVFLYFIVAFLFNSICYGNNLRFSSPTYDDAIIIHSNLDLQNQSSIHNWSGNGTKTNPFVIKDYFINTSPSIWRSIIIENVTIYVTIQNCTLTSGIDLLFCTNIKIVNNTITEKGDGVSVGSCSNILISENIIRAGLWGVNIIDSTLITVENNLITHSHQDGIHSAFSESCTISGNIISLNVHCGVRTLNSSANLIYNNSIFNNGLHYNVPSHGIFVDYSTDITILKNSLTNNSDGIKINSSNNITISDNSVFKNRGVGFRISNSDFNTISKNILNYNGMFLSESSYNQISQNNITNCESYGIYFLDECHNNAITGNYLWNNTKGNIGGNYKGKDNLFSENITQTQSSPWLFLPLTCVTFLFLGKLSQKRRRK